MRLWWLAVGACAGCGMLSGLDGLHVTDGGGGAADVTSSDAMDEGASDAGIDVGACEDGSCGAPAGFQPVLFAADRNTSCPSGSTTLDAVMNPSAPPNACPCECNYQPSCLPQPLVFAWGFNACNTQSSSQAQLDGGCNGANANLGTGIHLAAGPLAPSNACTNAPKINGQPSATLARLCTVTDCSTCATAPGLALCWAQSGDVACPQGTTKQSIGTAAQLACSACTACTSTAKCKGTFAMFSDGQCATPFGTLNVDGTCQGFSGNANIQSVKYTPALDVGVCTPGTSSASVTLVQQTTVCCP